MRISQMELDNVHCHICDKEDDSIPYDKLTGEFGPCGECQYAIDDCLAEFDIEEEDVHS